jgi:hypothetical protein
MMRVHILPTPEERERAKAELSAFLENMKSHLLAAIDRGQCVSVEHKFGIEEVSWNGMTVDDLRYTGGSSCAFVIEPGPRPRRKRPDLPEAMYVPKPDEPVVVEGQP